MNIVIGSGPSGIACANALLEQGERVTLLDVGLTCEPAKLQMINEMSLTEPETWNPSLVHQVSGQTKSNTTLSKKFPLKTVYGSTFPYVSPENSGIHQNHVHCHISWARGGLSNVWGAAMLPFSDEDTRDWPFTMDVLREHYAAISKMTDLTGTHDRLQKLFPFYLNPSLPPRVSRQASGLLKRFEKNAVKLESKNFLFGQSRLAVRTAQCRSCGLCLTGCPYHSIYDTSQTLSQMQSNPLFSYVPGYVVLECIPSKEHEIKVRCRSVSGKNEIHEFVGRRAFVGAGVLSTAKIILRSLGMARAELKMKFHPYFLLPMFLLHGASRVEEERLHTLAQIFLEIDDRKVSSYLSHLQIYTHNSHMRERLEAIRFIPRFIRERLLGHLIAIQGYLHSSESEPIRVQTSTDARGEIQMELESSARLRSRQVMRRIVQKLRQNAWTLGMFPIPLALTPGSPGDGNHIGGTFPMSLDPQALQTDLLGRLPQLKDVHIVDASVFPTLPATTLTYTVMANARRIALETIKGART